MKNIVVLVHDDVGQEARLMAALDVTRAVEGHMTCVDVTIMPILMGDICSAGGEVLLMEQEYSRECANRSRIEARLANERVSWTWVEATGSIAPCLGEQAALSDLIVVNRKLDASVYPVMQSAAADAVMKADRPILAVPDGARGIKLAGNALICWDGSSSCIEALRAAVPLLKLAQSVLLYVVDDGSIAVAARDAATYLSRHGIEAVIRTERLHREKAVALIFDAIRHHDSDYVVMGGFGHGRLVEALVGGVTRAMLEASPVPVFLAH
jgi:nucleotide-binding universal stress UspA family protein